MTTPFDRHHHTPIPDYADGNYTPFERAAKQTSYRAGIDAERDRWLTWLKGQKSLRMDWEGTHLPVRIPPVRKVSPVVVPPVAPTPTRKPRPSRAKKPATTP